MFASKRHLVNNYLDNFNLEGNGNYYIRLNDKKYKNVSIRTYECSVCNNIMDRDLNASINIMFEGLKQYMTTLV